jgi:hypothetical protein
VQPRKSGNAWRACKPNKQNTPYGFIIRSSRLMTAGKTEKRFSEITASLWPGHFPTPSFMSELQQRPEMVCNASLFQCIGLSGCHWLNKAGFRGSQRMCPEHLPGPRPSLVCPSSLPGESNAPIFPILIIPILIDDSACFAKIDSRCEIRH